MVQARFPPPGQAWSWAAAGKGGLLLWPMFGATNQLLGGLAFLVVWGVLVVESGQLVLVFEDTGQSTALAGGERTPIPPGRPHHLEIASPVTFHVEFHR